MNRPKGTHGGLPTSLSSSRKTSVPQFMSGALKPGTSNPLRKRWSYEDDGISGSSDSSLVNEKSKLWRQDDSSDISSEDERMSEEHTAKQASYSSQYSPHSDRRPSCLDTLVEHVLMSWPRPIQKARIIERDNEYPISQRDPGPGSQDHNTSSDPQPPSLLYVIHNEP